MLDRPGGSRSAVPEGTPAMNPTYQQDFDDPARVSRHSGWLIPLGVFLVTALLSALLLLYYLRPPPAKFRTEQMMPTVARNIVALRVHGHKLFVPANYIEFDQARSGGPLGELALFARLPQMSGYSAADAPVFASNAMDSPIVYILIREDKNMLGAADRLDKIYMPYIADPKGAPGPFGLTRYDFRDDSGYRRNDLFVGETPDGPLILLCVRFSPEVNSPSCLAIDQPLAHDVTLSWRFKRAHLARWREISGNVESLIRRFEKDPVGPP
jgi:hypothetical protein